MSNVKPGAMSERRIDVFFYGLFMDTAILRASGVAEPASPRRAFVEDFELRIGQRATLVPVADSRIYGMLFALTHTEMDKLYSEDSVSVYRPEAISVRLGDGSAIPALCFNLPSPPATEERNAQYAAKLRALAERIGLPPDYVSSIY